MRVSKRLVLSASLLVVASASCLAQPQPSERPFAVEQLLLDTSAFPSGWVMGEGGPSVESQAPFGGITSIERITVVFYQVDGRGGADENIHRFRSQEVASEEYNQWLEADFAPRDYDLPWTVPETVHFQSQVADRFHLACGGAVGMPMCRFLGQYEEYVVRFNTWMSPANMTPTDLARVLQAIDERMAQYLSNAD